MPESAEVRSYPTCAFDRTEEGLRIAAGIAAATGDVVVIHGKLGCGKTFLMRRWVVPKLEENHVVYFASCAPDLPEKVKGRQGELDLADALGRKCILIVDGFDRFLLRGLRSRREGLEKLFSQPVAKLVLIVNDQNLGELLALRTEVPGIMENLLEVSEVPLAEGLERLSATSGSGCKYAPETIAALKSELEQFSPKNRGLCPDLLKVIDSQAERILGRGSGAEFELSHLKENGGLRGILEASLGQRALAMRGEIAAATGEMAIGILEDLVESRNAALEYRPASTAHRIGLDPEDCRKAFSWLIGPSGLVRDGWGGQLELAPIQFEQILEESLEARRRKGRLSESIVRTGFTHWREKGALLQEELFREVDDSRTTVRVSQEETAFLVHCALGVAEGGDLEPAQYWLARIEDRDEKIAALLEALFDKQSGVRAKAALLLKEFKEPEVSSQLYRVALEDQDEIVRRQAVASLEGMDVAVFWKVLAQEARQASSRFRIAAVEALRIFKDQRTAQLLKELVNDPTSSPEIRVTAIETLSAMEVPESAHALVDVSLSDPDDEDRDLAARSLASIRSKDLAEEVVTALWIGQPAAKAPSTRGAVRSALWILGIVLLAGLAAILSLAIHVLVLMASPGLWAAPLLLTVAAGYLIPTAILLRRRSSLRFELLSKKGLLTTTAFAASIPVLLILPHGLLHMMVKRVRRGLFILWAEILGLLCMSLTAVDERYFQVFEIPHLGGVYWAVGLALVIGTWLWDVVAVGYNDLWCPHRRLARQRCDATLKQVLGNPHAAESILVRAEGQDRREANWARSKVKSLGESIPPALWVNLLKERGNAIPPFAIRSLQRVRSEETIRAIQGLWPDANPAMRARIVSILAGRPSQLSLYFLGKIRNLGWWAKVRYAWGLCQFRLALIPNTMWLTAVLLLPMPAIIVRELGPVMMDPLTLFVKLVNSKAAVEKPDLVVTSAKFVVDAIPEKATPQIAEVVGGIAGGASRWETRLDAIGLLTSIAGRADRPEMSAAARSAISQQIPKLLEMLNTPAKIEEKLQILKAMEGAADAQAVAALKQFVLRLGSQIQPDRVDSRLALNLSEAEPRTLISESLRILSGIATTDAANALAELQAPGVPESVRKPAQAQQSHSKTRLVERLRVEFNQGNYDQVVRTTKEVEPLLQAKKDRKDLVDVLLLASRATQQLSSFNSNSKKADDLNTQAIESAAKARLLDPSNTEAAHLLATSYSRQAERRRSWKRFDEALILVGNALQVDPRNADLLATRGRIYLDLKRKVEALKSFDEATQVDPAFAWAFAMQASIELEQKNYKRSLELAGRAIAADSNYAWGYTLLSESYHRMGKDQEAVDRLGELRQKYPDSTWPARSLMYVYHENLSGADPSAYQRNHDLYVEVEAKFQGRIPEQADFEAGFIEAKLTTGQYQAVIDRGEKLLENESDPNTRLAVSLLMYAASVLQGNSDLAAANLTRVEGEVKALPKDFTANWSYNGTRNYIRRQSLAATTKQPLDALFSAMSGKPTARDKEVISSNRQMLKTLK